MIVKNKMVIVVLFVSLAIVSIALGRYSPQSDSFTGLCVLSRPGFSVLYNGSTTVAVGKALEVGKVYSVVGRIRRTSRGLWIDAAKVEWAEPNFKLDSLKGAYWYSHSSPVLLVPGRVYLAYPLNASRGEIVSLKGLFYGRTFYPVDVERLGYLRTPEDGLPYLLRGVVMKPGNPAELWNGSELFRAYLPHGLELEAGKEVEVLGIVRFYSKITVYVDRPEDLRVVGMAGKVPVEKAEYGQIATGECLVLRAGHYLSLNCTSLRFYGCKARAGDVIRFEALRGKSSLRGLSCTLAKPRENLTNSICSPESGQFGKIEGRISWVKVYRNGFGIANVTNGTCWVLLKLPSSLGVSVFENESLTAYGLFATYHGKPAFQVSSGEDLCLGKRC